MEINTAVTNGQGQLKWVNLKSASGNYSSVRNKEMSGGSASNFAVMLQDKAEQPSKERQTGSSVFPSGVSYSGGLLWQQISASNQVNSGKISGEISTITRPTDYEDLIQSASAKYGIPVDLIKAVIDTESSFNPNVVSSAGAKGLMQLMDGTARGLGVSDPFDPAQSIDGGVRYLSYQLKRFDGQEKMALAAYNAGPGRVTKLGVNNDDELMAQLSRLPQETQAYISKIERARDKYAV